MSLSRQRKIFYIVPIVLILVLSWYSKKTIEDAENPFIYAFSGETAESDIDPDSVQLKYFLKADAEFKSRQYQYSEKLFIKALKNEDLGEFELSVITRLRLAEVLYETKQNFRYQQVVESLEVMKSDVEATLQARHECKNIAEELNYNNCQELKNKAYKRCHFKELRSCSLKEFHLFNYIYAWMFPDLHIR